MNPRDRILGILKMRPSASYKEICVNVPHRFDRDAVHDELKRLVAEGVIEVVSVQHVTSWKPWPPTAGTRSRYRLVRS